MLEITFTQLTVLIILAWITFRTAHAFHKHNFTIAREAQLLLVLTCIIVIARIVFFPWHHINGRIGTLKLDFAKTFPPQFNLIPIKKLFIKYQGWQMNIIGNITMFIPVGIIWPICFKKLDTPAKTILAGFGYSLLIELSQLLLYERLTDIDDLILNTIGVTIGAAIYFCIVKWNFGKMFFKSKNTDFVPGTTIKLDADYVDLK